MSTRRMVYNIIVIIYSTVCACDVREIRMTVLHCDGEEEFWKFHTSAARGPAEEEPNKPTPCAPGLYTYHIMNV